ncbi:MAG: esterase/lipase family protein [Streptosporangiaceae bacterium]
MDRLPIIYVRGYAGPTSGIDTQVDDPFYGFNKGATHVRVGGDGDPMFYQFEGPMLRLMTDEKYEVIVHGDQQAFLSDAPPDSLSPATIWVYRFYDQAATTFVPPPHEGIGERVFGWLHKHVTADGFEIETAAAGLYDLIELVLSKTKGADRVIVVAHSMGGLVTRCMMQKICQERDERDPDNVHDRKPARQLISKFFTYGTPHGGISFDIGALNWAEQAFGPAGSQIFSPPKMFGYLTPGAPDREPRAGDNWDPQTMPPDVFDTDNIFCLIGTDPADYGLSKIVVGPKSDGLVRVEQAYVRGANRAYVYKSHSGSYGEVNSEEGYQNLRRFLFGRWKVQVSLQDLPAAAATQQEAVWQADMRLAVRGLPVIMSEQLAAHWCPIQLNDEVKRAAGAPVPLVTTFLRDTTANADNGAPHGGRSRYSLTLRVYQLDQQGGSFRFTDHLEQVADWADTLIVDVGPDDAGTGLRAWLAWNSQVAGPIADFDPINAQPAQLTPGAGHQWQCTVPLPDVAKRLPILGNAGNLTITVTDREAAEPRSMP